MLRQVAFWLIVFPVVDQEVVRAQSSTPSVPERISFYLRPIHCASHSLYTHVINEDSLFRSLAQRGKSPERIYLKVFEGGKCLVDAKVPPFSPLCGRQGEHSLRQLIHELKRRDVRTYAAYDLLLWQQDDTGGIFTSYPGYEEIGSPYNTERPAEGRFASPFCVPVRRALLDMVRKTVIALPDVDGVLFEAGLSISDELGYSENARLSSIRELGLDPVDINRGSPHPLHRYAYREWCKWRIDKLSGLVAQLANTVRSVRPGIRVAALVYAGTYRWGVTRNYPSQDWLQWLAKGSVDELILMANWRDQRNRGIYQNVRSLIENTRTNADFAPLLRKRFFPIASRPDGFAPGSFREQCEVLTSRQNVGHVVLEVNDERDLAEASEFLQPVDAHTKQQP